MVDIDFFPDQAFLLIQILCYFYGWFLYEGYDIAAIAENKVQRPFTIICKTTLQRSERCDVLSLSSAEAPYGKFFNNIGFGFGRARRERWEEAFPAHCRFSLSPGVRPRNLYGQSSTKGASAEERDVLFKKAHVIV